MNKLLSIVGLLVLFTVIYTEVSARSSEIFSKPHGHRGPLKIVNGTTAEDGEFPYMVQLRDVFQNFECGGSIIGDKWILTAGHCVVAGMASIVYGTNILYDGDEPTTTIINVKESYVHPNYKFNSTEVGYITLYDVGLLELEESILFSSKAQPLQLADDDDVPFHVEGVLSGWGVNSTSGKVQTYLQKINLKLLTGLECARRIADYTGYDIFNPTHDLCSDDYWNGECYGDSGSPFVINGLQYGIVSWSIKPCGSNPGTYSRLTNPEYRNWVRNITGI